MTVDERREARVYLPFSFCLRTFSAACRMMVSLPWPMAWAAMVSSCAEACEDVCFCVRMAHIKSELGG